MQEVLSQVATGLVIAAMPLFIISLAVGSFWLFGLSLVIAPIGAIVGMITE